MILEMVSFIGATMLRVNSALSRVGVIAGVVVYEC